MSTLYGLKIDDNLNSRINFDYSRGLLWQIYNADWSFDDYVTYVNEPKHLINPVRDIRLFDHWFLEAGSKAPWFMVPIGYSPPVLYSLYMMYHYNSLDSPFLIFMEILAGIIYWTFGEYMLHRFLFHGEEYWMRLIPFNKYVWTLHFLFHGIHHAFPQDRYRLVMPPVPGYLLGYHFFYLPLTWLLPVGHLYNVVFGAMIGYETYDLMHYFMHHSNPKSGYLHQ